MYPAAEAVSILSLMVELAVEGVRRERLARVLVEADVFRQEVLF